MCPTSNIANVKMQPAATTPPHQPAMSTSQQQQLVLELIEEQFGSAVADTCRLLSIKGPSDMTTILTEAVHHYTISRSRPGGEDLSQTQFERQQVEHSMIVGCQYGFIVRKSKQVAFKQSSAWARSMLPPAARKRKNKSEQTMIGFTGAKNGADGDEDDVYLYEFSLSHAQRLFFRPLSSSIIQLNFGDVARVLWEVICLMGNGTVKEILDRTMATLKPTTTNSSASRQAVREVFQILVGVCAIIPYRVPILMSGGGGGGGAKTQTQHDDSPDEEEMDATAPSRSKRHRRIADDDDGDQQSSSSSSSDDDNHPPPPIPSPIKQPHLIPRLNFMDCRNDPHTRPHPSLFQDFDEDSDEIKAIASDTAKGRIDRLHHMSVSSRLGLDMNLVKKYVTQHVGDTVFSKSHNVQMMRDALERENLLWQVNEAYMVRAHLVHLIARHMSNTMGDSVAYEVVHAIFESGMDPLFHHLFEEHNNDPFDDPSESSRTLPQHTYMVNVGLLTANLLERGLWGKGKDVMTDAKARNVLLRQLIDSMTVTCADQGFMSDSSMPPKAVGIDLNKALANLRMEACFTTITRMVSPAARRIFSFLVRCGMCDEDHLTRSAVEHFKDTRKPLHELLRLGMISTQEIPRSSSYTPNSTMIMWRANVPRALAVCARYVDGALLHVFVRSRRHQERVETLQRNKQMEEMDVMAGDVDDDYKKDGLQPVVVVDSTTTTTIELGQDEEVRIIDTVSSSSTSQPGQSHVNPIDLVDMEDTDGRDPLEMAMAVKTHMNTTLASAMHKYLLMCDLAPWSEKKFASWGNALAAEFSYIRNGGNNSR